ncbi:MAG: DNA polymerase I [Bacilli bacterium]|nr:DNA polymerase I [Bacilli bacterium]
MNKKILFLIDGNSLMFRSYYATAYTGNLMKTKAGVYTNALYGFCNMLHRRLIEEADYAFVAFDAGSQTFRHQSFTDYKATRKPLPDELKMQIPYIKQYLDIMNVKRKESDMYEADDIIASVAYKFYQNFDEIRIITGDRDLLQLVNDKVKVYLTKRGIAELDEYNHNNFQDKAGVIPEQITDYKGMVGDPSDNLPGIRGIGEKTALKLLEQYHSLENIIKHIEEFPTRIKTLILKNKKMGLRCKELATLKQDVELGCSIDDLKFDDYDHEQLVEFFRQVEFYSFLKRMEKEIIVSEKSLPTIINDANADLKAMLNSDAYINAEVFSANYYSGEFLGLSIVTAKKSLFFPKCMIEKNQDLKEYLENPTYAKKTYDYKMLYSVLRRLGIEIANVDFDLLLAAYLINPSYAADDFKKTVDNFCSNDLSYYDNIYGANTKMRIPKIDIYARYSVDKGLIIKELETKLKSEIDKMELTRLYNIELMLSMVLAKVELNGLLIDIYRLDEIGRELTFKAEDYAEKVYQIANEQFNINSPKQLGEILFEKLHIPHGRKTKTGFSTSSDVLEKLAVDYPIARYVLEYRAYNKLITTYVNGLKEVIDENRFIHPIYKQALTATGRLSAVEPNIQNMPVRTEEGQSIREVFVSRFTNGYILSADYSQIELRVLAHLSQDEKMIKAFNESIDFHALTASQIFEVDLEAVTKEMRRTAKAINFGIIYGMSAWGLSEAINITPLEANIYINKYFYNYDKVKVYLDSLIEGAKTDGYTKTILNRRRYIPEIVSTNANLRSFGERTAMNAPIQGSAADIIKVAMIRIDQKMTETKLKSLMIAQVHDELVFDCSPDEVEIMKRIILKEMTEAVTLKVRLTAEVNIGRNWAEVK